MQSHIDRRIHCTADCSRVVNKTAVDFSDGHIPLIIDCAAVSFGRVTDKVPVNIADGFTNITENRPAVFFGRVGNEVTGNIKNLIMISNRPAFFFTRVIDRNCRQFP